MRVPVLAAAVSLVMASAPAAAQAPPLAGSFQRDSARSDQATDAIREGITGLSSTGTGQRVPFTVTRAGGAGSGGAPPSAALPPGTPQGRTSINPADVDMTNNPAARAAMLGLLSRAALRFEPVDDGMVIHFGDEAPLHFRAGKQTLTRWGVDDLEVTVKLAANRIEIDTRGPERLRVQERYELKRNGEVEAQITSEKRGFQKAARVKYTYVAAER